MLINYNSPYRAIFVSGLIVLVLGVFVLPFNQLTLLWGDDYSRILHLSAEDASVISLTFKQYIEIGGRWPVYLGIYSLLAGGNKAIQFFDIANAAGFGLLTLAVFWCGCGRLPRTVWDFMVALIMGLALWMGVVCIAEVALWKTGSIAYMWVISLNLFVVGHCVFNQGVLQNGAKAWLQISLAVIGVIAGSGLESIALPIALLLIWRWREAHSKASPALTCSQLALMLGYAVGAASLFLSPGNFGRLDAVGVPQAGRFPYLLPFMEESLTNLMSSWMPVLFVLSAIFGKWRGYSAGRRSGTFVLVAVGVVSFHFAVIPWIPLQNRTLFPVEVMLLIASLALLGSWADNPTPGFKVLLFLACVLLGAAAMGDRHVVTGDLEYLKAVVEDRERKILYQRSAGQTDIQIYPLRISSMNRWLDSSGEYRRGRYFVIDLSSSPEYWINQLYALRYGLHSIRMEPQ